MALGGSAARRYAEAMLEIALAADAVGGFRASLQRLRAGLDRSALRALREPGVPMAKRVAAAQAAAAPEPVAVRSLLRLLVERDRISLLPAIAQAYGQLVDRREGIAEALLTTAVELDEPQRAEAVRRLERASGKRIRATFAVDPALIGGAKIQVGDRLVDASLSARLAALRDQLAS